MYTYNANHLIPVFSTTIPGNPQYRYPVPGKNQSGTRYRYSVPEKIRAVLNTGIQYHNTGKSSIPVSSTGKKSERYSIPVFSTGKNQSGTQYRYSIPEKRLSGTQYRDFFERYRSLIFFNRLVFFSICSLFFFLVSA
jgi:hypothetical protein